MPQVTAIPPVTTGDAYGANYVVGGLLTFSHALINKGGILENVMVTAKQVENIGAALFLFDIDPTATIWTDDAVAAIAAADIPKVIAVIPLAFNNQLGTHTAWYAAGLGVYLAPGGSTLYGVLVVNDALTNNFTTVSDVSVTLSIAPER
jgi:hypothetical protein